LVAGQALRRAPAAGFAINDYRLRTNKGIRLSFTHARGGQVKLLERYYWIIGQEPIQTNKEIEKKTTQAK
jgi:hypothetical protein